MTEGLTLTHHLQVACRSCPCGIARCWHQCARASLLPHNSEPCHTSSQQAVSPVRSLVALCGSTDSTPRPIGLLTAVCAGYLGNHQMCPHTLFHLCHHLCNLNMARGAYNHQYQQAQGCPVGMYLGCKGFLIYSCSAPTGIHQGCTCSQLMVVGWTAQPVHNWATSTVHWQGSVCQACGGFQSDKLRESPTSGRHTQTESSLSRSW